MKKRSGITVIEILISMVIVAVFAGSTFILQTLTTRNLDGSDRLTQAYFYLHEGVEILRNMGQDNFPNLNVDTYALSRTGNEYSLLTGSGQPENLPGGFTRSIVVEPVNRNAALTYTPDGDYPDYSARITTISVNWEEAGTPKAVSVTKLITEWQAVGWVQTRQEDFAKGSDNNTKVVRTDHDPFEIPGNGGVQLGSGKTTGHFTSNEHDTGSSSTVYEYFQPIAYEPAGTQARYQIRTASTKNGLNSATFVGPDGTSSTYYLAGYTPIVTSPSATGRRYVQWRAYLTSNSGQISPSVEYVMISY